MICVKASLRTLTFIESCWNPSPVTANSEDGSNKSSHVNKKLLANDNHFVPEHQVTKQITSFFALLASIMQDERSSASARWPILICAHPVPGFNTFRALIPDKQYIATFPTYLLASCWETCRAFFLVPRRPNEKTCGQRQVMLRNVLSPPNSSRHHCVITGCSR